MHTGKLNLDFNLDPKKAKKGAENRLRPTTSLANNSSSISLFPHFKIIAPLTL